MKLTVEKKKIFVKIMLEDLNIIKGELLGLDQHMNTILKKTKEFRYLNGKNVWESRFIGLVFIRGDSITSLSFEKYG